MQNAEVKSASRRPREAVEWGRGKGFLSPSLALEGPTAKPGLEGQPEAGIGAEQSRRSKRRNRPLGRVAVDAITEPEGRSVDQSRGTATWAAGAEPVPWRSQGA